MDYRRHYEMLIGRARNRTLKGYTEKHHVIPRCLGGTDRKDNLVRLTPEEHYVAHQLLAKMHPDHTGIIFSAFMMGSTRKSNKLYGWLKRRRSSLQKQLQTGRKQSEAAKAKMRKPKTAEAKANIAQAAKDRATDDYRAKQRASKVGLKKFKSPDGIIKMFRAGEAPEGWQVASKPPYVKQGTKGKYTRTPEHRKLMSQVIASNTQRS